MRRRAGGGQVLVQYGAAVNGRDEAGWTPAHTAVALSRLRALAALYQLGAELGARTEGGQDVEGLARALRFNHTLKAIQQLPRAPPPSCL